jgi:hypothetical protein
VGRDVFRRGVQTVRYRTALDLRPVAGEDIEICSMILMALILSLHLFDAKKKR